MHFENLWEKGEKLHQEASKNDTSSSIIEELLIKINLYKMIDQKQEIPLDEKEKLKSRTMGEILITLTNLSLKDNVNVFAALDEAIKFRSINFYQQKYQL